LTLIDEKTEKIVKVVHVGDAPADILAAKYCFENNKFGNDVCVGCIGVATGIIIYIFMLIIFLYNFIFFVIIINPLIINYYLHLLFTVYYYCDNYIIFFTFFFCFIVFITAI
jgi:hypothetical protein